MTNKEQEIKDVSSDYFLSNDLFIYWATNPNKEMDAYWSKFISNNPHLRDSFVEAINEFDKLTEQKSNYIDERNVVENRLASSLKLRSRKRKIRYCMSAAAVILLVVASPLIYLNLAPQHQEIIYGSVTDNNEVQLFYNDEVLDIGNNSELDFSGKDETAIIKDSNTLKKVKLKNHQIHKLIVPFGKRTSIILSDGSTVWLNSGTEMEFPSSFGDNIREIKIQGEIFIEVVNDNNKPFIVHTPHSTVTVLGTAFNVVAYPGQDTEFVILVEGSVQVYCNDSYRVLSPNQMAILEEGEISVKKVDASRYTSWTKGYIALNQTPLQDVFEIISRYYNIEFSCDSNINIGNKTCSGELYLSDSVDDVLDAFLGMTFLKYNQKENTIHITQ